MTDSLLGDLTVPPSRAAVAAALATLGGLAAIPLVLAQLDFAGLIDVFGITPDVPRGVRVLAAVGGCLTLLNVACALLGAALAVTGSRPARPVLFATAVAGFATALMLWLPYAITLAAAASLLPGPGTTPGRRPIAP